MTVTSVRDLRRIADAVSSLCDRTVHDVVMRSDCRQLRLTLDDGQILLVSVLLDEDGRPRLDADILRTTEETPIGQLEVEFDDSE